MLDILAEAVTERKCSKDQSQQERHTIYHVVVGIQNRELPYPGFQRRDPHDQAYAQNRYNDLP